MTGVDNSEGPRSAIIPCTFSVLIAASLILGFQLEYLSLQDGR